MFTPEAGTHTMPYQPEGQARHATICTDVRSCKGGARGVLHTLPPRRHSEARYLCTSHPIIGSQALSRLVVTENQMTERAVM